MPPRWFTITLDEFKEDDTGGGGGGQTGASSVASSDAITSDDGLSRNVPLPSPINDELRSLQESLLSTSNCQDLDDIDEASVPQPERVLVYTTVALLGLLALSKRGSVDGTFKCMSRLWHQLFVLMVEYRGDWFPVAFGWLPNKEALSYHIFFLLLLGEFKFRSEEIKQLYGKNKLRLRKLKLDFEVAMHTSLSPLFILEGNLILCTNHEF